MRASEDIRSRSERVAKNTILLYLRMFLMMLVGLFTSRIILKTLGETDYGTYNAVAGIVMMFTFLSNSVSHAISRFLTYELGRDDEDRSRLGKIFAASLAIQIIMSVLLVLVVETLGLWFLNHRMNIPAERMDAAFWVLQASCVTLILSLLSIPYNATIIAHERMGAFAYISILEAILKLLAALSLVVSPWDRLVSYAVLMCLVALAVRCTYAAFCRRHFPESKASPLQKGVLDGGILRQMSGFAGWSFFGSSAMVLNTQGLNMLSNIFWGVGINAARGIATNVESIVKQFVSNFMTALNPQITKSWAAGEKDYCFETVTKGGKFCFLLLLFFAIPLGLEASTILDIWFVDVPANAALFTRLVTLGIMADMVCNSLTTLELAYGRIRNYYLITGGIAYLALPLTWILVKYCDCGPVTPYIVFIGMYLLVDIAKMAIIRVQTGFDLGRYLKEILLKCGGVAAVSCVLPCLAQLLMPEGAVRLIVVFVLSTASIAAATWVIALNDAEKSFIRNRFGR